VLVFFQFIAAILLWRPGRGPSWPIWVSLAFFLAAEAQSALGYARTVSLTSRRVCCSSGSPP
jgi:hypothetical protein